MPLFVGGEKTTIDIRCHLSYFSPLIVRECGVIEILASASHSFFQLMPCHSFLSVNEIYGAADRFHVR